MLGAEAATGGCGSRVVSVCSGWWQGGWVAGDGNRAVASRRRPSNNTLLSRTELLQGRGEVVRAVTTPLRLRVVACVEMQNCTSASGTVLSCPMPSWAAALIAGSVQLLLAQLLIRRPGSLAKCLRRACSVKSHFASKRSLKARLLEQSHKMRDSLARASSTRSRSGAQRHWDVIRLHVFEQGFAQGFAERTQEDHYEKRYNQMHFGRRHTSAWKTTPRESLRKTADLKSHYHRKAQADDLQCFITSFKESQVRHAWPSEPSANLAPADPINTTPN